MKIVIVGSHGTGKTTLSRRIAKEFGFNYIGDVVADAFRLKFPINEETPPETQFWILSKQLELERNTPEPWVMEKSLWDNLVYGSYSIKDKKVIDVITEIVNRNAKYDLVIYLPVQFPIPNDGIRSLNEKFQKTIDHDLKTLLDKNKISYTTIRGDEKQTLNKALDIIRQKLKSSPRI